MRERKIDAYGNAVTQNITAFHKSRVMFAVIDGVLLVRGNTEQSHKDWFAEQGWLQDFESIIRGYYDNTGVYFYKGSEFATDTELETFVLGEKEKIQEVLGVKGLPVYCGLIKGKPGEKYKPDKLIFEL